MIKIKNKNKFEKKILNGTGLQVVRFCAVWSGPCQIMGPLYTDISEIYKDKISFYKIDVDEAPLLKDKLGVNELPTILFYKNGVVIDLIVGLLSRELLIEKMENLLNV
jgi:thioredoxin 1